MREIPLTQGQVALVDDDQHERLSRFRWHVRKSRNTFYATRSVRINKHKVVDIQMHHEIIGFPPNGHISDHRDGNGLNNLKKNLRHVTARQNCQNKRNVFKTSQYPGVSWVKQRKKWLAQITVEGINKNLGHYKTEIEAFEVYRQAINAIGEETIDTK